MLSPGSASETKDCPASDQHSSTDTGLRGAEISSSVLFLQILTTDADLPPPPRCVRLIYIYTHLNRDEANKPGPSTWNALPDNIRAIADPAEVRKLLKSNYFSVAFNNFVNLY